jgi:hypothetical protein
MACDDRVALNGAFDAPLTPIDPVATGLRAVIRNGIGATVIDDTLPTGAYDGATRTGWRVRASASRTTWSFSRPADAGPVSRAVLQQRANAPGLKIRVKGTKACFAAPVSSLPLSASVVLTPPQAVDGQCGEARFPGPPEAACVSQAGGARIVCR